MSLFLAAGFFHSGLLHRTIQTLDEFQSTTYGHGSPTSLSYQTYYDLLINACVRYDKTKKGQYR